MAKRDLDLRISIPHQYFRSYVVQSSVNERRETMSKELTVFRGYVVSRGFDIENVLSEIITHLLAINRPQYENETEDEYLHYLSSRSFLRDGLLAGRDFGFGKKVHLLRNIMVWIPKKLKDSFVIPEFAEVMAWRNRFAHTPIVLELEADHSVLPMIEVRKDGKTTHIHLTEKTLKEIVSVMETCYEASFDLEQQLCCRFGDARPMTSNGGDERI